MLGSVEPDCLLRPVVQDDWPGGVRQMYLACEPLTQQLLRRLQPGGTSAVLQRVVDDADGVNMLSCGLDDALVFPTAETFEEARLRCPQPLRNCRVR